MKIEMKMVVVKDKEPPKEMLSVVINEEECTIGRFSATEDEPNARWRSVTFPHDDLEKVVKFITDNVRIG